MNRSTPNSPPSLCVFFTLGMSLRLWEETGLLDREIRIYNDLTRRGVRVAFFTYGDATEQMWQDRIPGITIIPAYAHRSRWPGKALAFLQSFFLPFHFRAELKAWDIFKTNQMLGSWVPLIASRLYRPRKVFLVRCGYEHYRFALLQNRPRVNQWALRVLSGLAYRKADHILLSSPEAKTFVRTTFHIPAHKISLCPNLIDTEKFQPKPQTQQNERVIYVGRLSEQKNLFELILAAKKAETGLDLYGKGELETSLKSHAERIGADVRFLGTVPNDEVPELLARYSLYALPSFYEGNPKSLLEAMSCGQTVIGSRVEGIAGIVRHQENGWLCETSADSIAEAIVTLKQDASLRKTLGAQARQTILNGNSLEKIVEIEQGAYHAAIEAVR